MRDKKPYNCHRDKKGRFGTGARLEYNQYKDVRMLIYCTREFKLDVDMAAMQQGLSMSEYVRRVLEQAVEEHTEVSYEKAKDT